MNREYSSRVSSKKSERLLKNVENTTGDYFFLPHPVYYTTVRVITDAKAAATAAAVDDDDDDDDDDFSLC